MTGIVRKIVVREHERGLLFRDGEFRELLAPGTHWCLDLTGRLAVEVVDVSPAASRPGLQDLLLQSWSPAERARYEVIEARPGQAVVVYLNGRLEAVLGPGRRAVYRKGVAEVTASVINISAPYRNAASAPRPVRAETRDRLALLTCADVR
jgi:hypothetical protein